MNLSSFIAGFARRPVASTIEEDSEVIRVRGEVPEYGPIPSLLVRGPDLLDPTIDDASSWENRVTVGVEDWCGGIADGHIDFSPGVDAEGSVVATGFVAEVGDAGVVGRREYEALFGED